MKLSDFNTVDSHNEGAELNIINPHTGEPTDVFITIAGPDSKVFRLCQKSQLKEVVHNMTKKDGGEEELIDNDAEFLASITLGWRGIYEDDEKTELEFSKAKAKELYLMSPFVLDQVNNFTKNRKNFTNG